ncbi:hypothetical protein QO000_003133 [Alkalihalobacillus hemicentroti]|uniref:Uncharacterized protein n=1 Tax=Guptibacillus hwajinpoensis TaxID=208199 RepID=A0ABU0K772_9BACL|nr:hypothetical protein [Alkalihalobacillus hemicentroti]
MDNLNYQLEVPQSENATLEQLIKQKKSMVVFVRHLG